MVTKRTYGEIIFDLSNTIFMIIISIVFIYPLFYCLVASISDPALLAVHMGLLVKPLGFSLNAYEMVFNNRMIIRGLLNSIFYVVVGTSINILITSFAAYALSRKGYYWKKYIMFFILFTMYFSGGLVPFYLQVKNLGLLDSPWAILIPYAMNAFYMIIMRTYFMSIPYSMEESALIDGANDFTILFKVILPLAMPVVAVMVIYYGVGHWNSWFPAMIFLLKNREWHPLQLILRDILTQNNANQFTRGLDQIASQQLARLIQYALIILSTLPIIMIYPVMQKHFIKGVMIGSIKE